MLLLFFGMPHSKESTVTVPVSSSEVAEAVFPILEESGYNLGGNCAPGVDEFMFFSQRKMLRAKIQGSVRISPAQAGSHVKVAIETAANEPSGLLDGKRNQRSANELGERIAAALGTV